MLTLAILLVVLAVGALLVCVYMDDDEGGY